MDAIREMLAERVVELEAERDALVARLEDSQDWEEVALRFQAERNALAAHVERLASLGRELRSEEDAERAAVVAEWFDKALEKAPTTTSLARIKAQWQDEALEEITERIALTEYANTARSHLWVKAEKRHRNAKGDPHG